MEITGIVDEGSPEIEEQIKIHKELGWNSIELRLIGRTNVCSIDDATFDKVVHLLEDTGMKIVCFASSIANWSRPVTSDFSIDIEELKRAAPRMRRLKTKYIRIMSYPNDGLQEKDWRRETIRRISELSIIADSEGVILVHENCSGWGGAKPENQKILMEEIDSPSLRIVFDTGNPVGEGHPASETWDFYQAAKPFIVHIHIKDCKTNNKGETEYTFPGQGDSMVRKILLDVLESGYTGAFSIEPHIVSQIHIGNMPESGINPKEIYLEYGKKTNALFKDLKRRPGF